MLDNTDELGELCEALEVELLRAILPQTADQLLAWGVIHNRYQFVELIIGYGKEYITNTPENCVGQKVTKRAARDGHQELFVLLISKKVDVDLDKVTAFMSTISEGEYWLAHTMLSFGEYRLEQRDQFGNTPLSCLGRSSDLQSSSGKQSLETRLREAIATEHQNEPRKHQRVGQKKQQ